MSPDQPIPQEPDGDRERPGGYDARAYWQGLHERRRASLSAVGYSALGEGFNREAYRIRLTAAERLLRRAGVAPVRSVLEGAVGVGAYGPLWRRLGPARWTGVDISPVAVGDLSARHPAGRFLAADLTAGDLGGVLDGETFDLVTAIDVLYHLVRPQAFAAALDALAARVAPGGHLLVSDVFCEVPRQTAAHVRRRPLACYQRALRPHGLELMDRETVFAVLADPLPRLVSPAGDRGLLLIWRLLSATVRLTPAPLRDRVGAGMVRSFAPLDRALGRRLGGGVNLELALFRRSARRDKANRRHAVL